MRLDAVIKSLSTANAAIKNTASPTLKTGWYPTFSASGQDVWLPNYRFNQKGIVVSAVGARCGKAFKADGKWNICANTHALSVDESIADRDYCWYLLNNENWWIKGGTAQPFVKVKESLKREFEFPSLSEQRAIVRQLDTITRIIDLKSAEFSALDTLVKSRFVEMFGDFKHNTRGFEMHPGHELFKFASGKFLPEEKRLAAGVPVYGGNGISWYTDSSLVDFPTIVIGRVGALCGNIHVVSEPIWITDNAIYIKEQKTDKLTLPFLAELMASMDFHQYADFSGQPKITQKPLESLMYLTPPLTLQNQFADFVAQVEKTKATIRDSRTEMQRLFDNLMQAYFGKEQNYG